MESDIILQLACAIFIGNAMTLAVVKGYQRMKVENAFRMETAFYYLAPLAFVAGTLWFNF